MAWTTSASLRAQPWLRTTAAAHIQTAKRLGASCGASVALWHPSLAFAALLAVLGASAPLLPASLTAILLLCAGSGLAVFGPRLISRSARPATGKDNADSGTTQRAPTSFQTSEITLADQPSKAAVSRQLPHGQQGRSWAELMARVNHDLRTPLNAVIGFSELMVLELFGPLGDERYQDYVHHIRDSATELLKSAEDTLALTALVANPSRRDAACACDLELLAADAWAFVSRKAAGRAIDFQPSIPSDMEVIGEQRALRQILVNMLSEAIARAAYGERVVLTAIAEGELVELTVSVSRERPSAVTKESSLAICLARTLLELQGASLVEVKSSSQGWRAVTVLDRAAQPDFFTERFRLQTSFGAQQGQPVFA
jgi:signal transduction histidine kinase